MIGILAMAAVTSGPAPDMRNMRGNAGICIRFDRPAHVANAVVVISSGNPRLDAILLEGVRTSKSWPAPEVPSYHDWIGINVGVNDAKMPRPVPDCAKYRLPAR